MLKVQPAKLNFEQLNFEPSLLLNRMLPRIYRNINDDDAPPDHAHVRVRVPLWKLREHRVLHQ